MRRAITLLLVVVLFSAYFVTTSKPVSGTNADENTWTKLTPMHQARGGLGTVAVDGSIYAIGGHTGSGLWPVDYQDGFVGTNEVYNISADTWTYKSPMPTPRDNFAIAAYQNKIYCMGGHARNGHESIFTYAIPCATNEVYDVTTDTWETKKLMPASGMDLQARIIDGKILVGGYGQSYLYDPSTDSWTNSSDTPLSFIWHNDPSFVAINLDNETKHTDVYGGTAAQTSGKEAKRSVYVMGLAPVRKIEQATVTEVYIPETATWTKAANMTTLRRNFALAVTADDVIYAIGGYNVPNSHPGYASPTAANEQYTPIGYGTPDPSYVIEHTPPRVLLQSPLNKTYNESSVSLTFTLDKAVNWVVYSVDGKQNVTVTDTSIGRTNSLMNLTIANLTNGMHDLTVYANDTYGNIRFSNIDFTIAKQLFPVTEIAVFSGASITVACAILLFYFKKHKQPKMFSPKKSA